MAPKRFKYQNNTTPTHLPCTQDSETILFSSSLNSKFFCEKSKHHSINVEADNVIQNQQQEKHITCNKRPGPIATTLNLFNSIIE